MRPNGYTTLLALFALASALPAQAQYGTGVVLDVPRATGTITLDGAASEPDWVGAPEVSLIQNWDGEYSGNPDPDVNVTGKLLWKNGVLYVYVLHHDFQPFYWGTAGNPWQGEQILVGVDLTHAGDDQIDDTFSGWPDNVPDLGPVAYKVTGALGEGDAGITHNWGYNGIDPVAEGYVDGSVFVDEANFRWGVEMAIYGAEIALGNQIGSNLGGASADEEFAAVNDGDGAYAYYAWQVCPEPDFDSFCQFPGGNVMSDAESFASLRFVEAPPFAMAVNPSAVSTSSPGQFRITYRLCNNSGAAVTGDVYFTASGGYRGLIQSGTLPAGQCTPTLSYTQQVPAGIPAGTYTYTVRAGRFPDVSVVSDMVQVTVATPGADAAAPEGAATWAVVDADPWAVAGAPTQAAVAPNPFTSQSSIRYEVAEASDVRLAVYDVLGREVARLVDGRVEAGPHAATFDARGLPAGTYVYHLIIGNDVQMGRMTLVQ